MDAGPALDAVVARRVCGWQSYSNDPFPPYSSEIAAAWLVVERLRPSWLIELVEVSAPTDEWIASFRNPEAGRHGAGCCAPTAPHAICLAALYILAD